jgi:hypothetical protein
MASRLVACDDCGREISRRAAACPHCGCPVSASAAKVQETDEPAPKRKGVRTEPKASGGSALRYAAVPLVGGAALAGILYWSSARSKDEVRHPPKETSALDRDLAASPAQRLRNCHKWVPITCRAILGCQRGFSSRLPSQLASAAPKLAEIRDGAAQEQCVRDMTPDECGKDFGWGDEADLENCFRRTDCTCAPDTAFCFPRQLGNDRPDYCPSVSLPVGHQYVDLINDATTALAFAYPYSSGDIDKETMAADVFRAWAISRLKWSDVQPSETSPAKVFKDQEAEYGRRYCASGYLISLEKVGSYFKALIMVSGEVIHLSAIGETGDLVEHMNASFCGLVLGTYSYSNTGGGTTHSIDVVGMFKLPSNVAR